MEKEIKNNDEIKDVQGGNADFAGGHVNPAVTYSSENTQSDISQ